MTPLHIAVRILIYLGVIASSQTENLSCVLSPDSLYFPRIIERTYNQILKAEPCPKDTWIIWHSHPLLGQTPEESCFLGSNDLLTIQKLNIPYSAVSAANDSIHVFCWWRREQLFPTKPGLYLDSLQTIIIRQPLSKEGKQMILLEMLPPRINNNE